MTQKDTTGKTYAKRLAGSEETGWKNKLNVQQPYYWNILRLQPGKTLDIGCGVGRILKKLPAGSVGVDHNKYSIDYAKARGLQAFVPSEFLDSKKYKRQKFDSILLSHVLEHMTVADAVALLKTYLPYLTKNGQVIVICPQERGYASDSTHVTFMDQAKIDSVFKQIGLEPRRSYSFPLPRLFGKAFTYNEFVSVGKKHHSTAYKG
jgi:2-polyprenyl-3-methyl-5-hydroxy-6-metoxy-1,4-benzoquinol methylase